MIRREVLNKKTRVQPRIQSRVVIELISGEKGLMQVSREVEVTQKLGKSQSYVSKCESGERRVDFVELLDFAKLYQKSLDFFRP
jgi:hypothetical protein